MVLVVRLRIPALKSVMQQPDFTTDCRDMDMKRTHASGIIRDMVT